MKLYPYSRIKTENLQTLLLVTRVLGVFGYLLIIVSIGLLISTLFMGSETTIKELGHNFTQKITTRDNTDIALLGSLWSIVSSISLLVLSGLLAVVVSCEYKYTNAN
jgi:hypothetical protein